MLFKQYKEYLKEINKIKDELDIIKIKHATAKTTKEHININIEYQSLQKVLITKNNLLESLQNITEIFYNTDWVNLENQNDKNLKLESIEILKQAVNIIHKLRNSFEHDAIKPNKIIKIDNNKFNIEIPIEYLDGLNKGRIIVEDKDKVILEKTNVVSGTILEELGYDIYKVESFFYNVEPGFLSYLLEFVDYNTNKLYELPYNVFRYQDHTKKLINNNFDFETIKKLPNESFYDIDKTIKLLNYFKNKNLELPNKLIGEAYHYPENTINLIEKGVNLNELIKLSVWNFVSGYKYYKKVKERIDYLHEKGLTDDMISWQAYSYSESYAELIDNGLLPKTIAKLSHFFFEYNQISETIVFKKYLEKRNIDINELDTKLIELSKFTMKLLEEGLTLDNISKLSVQAICNPERTMELLNKGISYEQINILPYDIVYSTNDIIQIFKCLKERNIEDYSILSDECWIYYNEATTLLLDELKDDEVGLLKKISVNPLLNIDSTIKFIKFLRSKNIKIDRVSEKIYNDLIFKDIQTIILDLEEKNIDPRIIECLPKEAFIGLNGISTDDGNTYKTITKTDEIIKEIEDLIIIFNKFGFNFDKKLPTKVFNINHVKKENLLYLIDKVENNYDKLNEFPVEFFINDFSLMEEMNIKYNCNLNKSIFGVDNPKIISLIVYMNSVFSQYRKEYCDSNYVDIDPIKVIHTAFNDTYIYRNNINDININQETYLNQFIFKNNHSRNINQIKNFILDKLRNSSVHFRFKQVKDQNGNIIPNKIYIYDKYDEETITNFNLIIDLKDLLEITRQIEIGLINKSLNDSEKIINESNRFFSKHH